MKASRRRLSPNENEARRAGVAEPRFKDAKHNVSIDVREGECFSRLHGQGKRLWEDTYFIPRTFEHETGLGLPYGAVGHTTMPRERFNGPSILAC